VLNNSKNIPLLVSSKSRGLISIAIIFFSYLGRATPFIISALKLIF